MFFLIPRELCRLEPGSAKRRHCPGFGVEQGGVAPGLVLWDMETEQEDPVCGMSVDPLKSPDQHTHDGTRYYFCSADCKEKFTADPGVWLSDPAPAKPADTAPIWFCSNLPDVEHYGPGNCPFCGELLQLRDPGADLEEDENPALVSTRPGLLARIMRRRR